MRIKSIKSLVEIKILIRIREEKLEKIRYKMRGAHTDVRSKLAYEQTVCAVSVISLQTCGGRFLNPPLKPSRSVRPLYVCH